MQGKQLKIQLKIQMATEEMQVLLGEGVDSKATLVGAPTVVVKEILEEIAMYQMFQHRTLTPLKKTMKMKIMKMMPITMMKILRHKTMETKMLLQKT